MNIIEMVKDKNVNFLYARAGNLVYTTECGFLFPVPFEDMGEATFNHTEKAIHLMRYIRKQIELLTTAAAD